MSNILGIKFKSVKCETVIWKKYPTYAPVDYGQYLILRRPDVYPRIDIRVFTDYQDGQPRFEYDDDIDYWAKSPNGGE